MNVKFNPLRNGILLKLEPEQAQSTVITVVKATEGLARTGVVTAVGPEVRDIRVGQRVMASITAGVELADQTVLITEKAILGVEHPD